MAAISPTQTDILFSLDTPQLVPISLSESYLKGWFVPPESAESWELTLSVDGHEEPVYTGFPRSDVQQHVGAPGAGKSGFIARLRTPQPGQRVSLAVEANGVVRELIGNIGQQQHNAFSEADAGQGKVFSYQEWLFQCEPQLFPSGTQMTASTLSYRPVFSLLIEFQECHLYFLSMFLRTLSAQIYPHWQLCIAGRSHSHSESFQLLQNFAATDRRVTLVPDVPAAFEAAIGDFVVPARLYDELHPFALWELATSLQGRELDLVYSDEDRIDLFGMRDQPQFKPDFDPEHLLSINYVGSLAAVRSSLARRSGGFRSFPSGAREWDFLLRCVEGTDRDKVAHIAKPLYHTRTQEALTDAGVKITSTQPDDLCRVIREQAARTGKQAVAQIGFPIDTVRLKYQLPGRVCVSTFLRDEDGVFQTAVLGELINKHRVEFYGVLNGIVHRLADSSSRPPILSLAEIAGDVLLFINRPIDLLNHFFLEELIAQALRPDCGLVAGLSVDLRGRFIHTGIIRNDRSQGVDPFAGANSRLKALGRHVRVTRSVQAVSEDFFAVRREHVEAVGGFLQLSSMPQFVRALAEYAHSKRLQVLVTPYAIGTFDYLEPQPVLSSEAIADWNPNLSEFADPYEILGS